MHRVGWKKMQSLIFHQSAVANVLGIVLIPNADDFHHNIATETGNKRRLKGSIDTRIGGSGNNGCGKKGSVTNISAKQAHKPQTATKTKSLRPDSSTSTCGIMKLYDLKGWLKQTVGGRTSDSLAEFCKEDEQIGDDKFAKDSFDRVYIDGSRIEDENYDYGSSVDEMKDMTYVAVVRKKSQHQEVAHTPNTARIESAESLLKCSSTQNIMKLHDIKGWIKSYVTHPFGIVSSVDRGIDQHANEIDAVETSVDESQIGGGCIDDSRRHHSATDKGKEYYIECFSIDDRGDANTTNSATYVSDKSEIVTKRMANTDDCIKLRRATRWITQRTLEGDWKIW
jgi:hypothetical protein